MKRKRDWIERELRRIFNSAEWAWGYTDGIPISRMPVDVLIDEMRRAEKANRRKHGKAKK